MKKIRHFFFIYTIIILTSVLTFAGCGKQATLNKKVSSSNAVTPVAAYFKFKNILTGFAAEEFIFALTNPTKIAEARAILNSTNPATRELHISGIIVKSQVSFNPSWHFSLAPDSVEFFEMAAEVCDASVGYVEAHLAEVGGALLPNNRWCPWNSYLVSEITL